MTAQEFILKKIEELNGLISKGPDRESNIKLKQELSEMIHLWNIFDKYKVNKNTIETIFEVPDSHTGYSDYRIVNDCESDDPQHWIELNINNESIKLSEGDIIIKKK